MNSAIDRIYDREIQEDKSLVEKKPSEGLLSKSYNFASYCVSYPFKRPCSYLVEQQFYFNRYTRLPGRVDTCRDALLVKCTGREITVQTQDGDSINAAIFKGVGTLKKAVLFAKGVCGYYEDTSFTPESSRFIQFLRTKVHPDITVLLFNPRGVGRSSGRPSPQKLGEDVAALFRHLQKDGYELEDTVAYGYSMGAMSAIYGARKIQKENSAQDPLLNIIVDRTFANLAAVAGNSMGGGKVGSVVETIFWMGGWDTSDTISEFSEIKGNKAIIESKEDNIVSEPFSLYTALKVSDKLGNVDVIHLASEVGTNMTHIVGSIADKSLFDTDRDLPFSHHKRSFTEEEGDQLADLFRKYLKITSAD